jgi:hypothetical protein
MSMVSSSQTTCPCYLAARTLGKGLAFSLPFAAVALAVAVLAPWRSLDAAAPAPADDLLSQGNIVRPVPSALERRGANNNGNSDGTLMLKNWTYTFNSEGF